MSALPEILRPIVSRIRAAVVGWNGVLPSYAALGYREPHYRRPAGRAPGFEHIC
jgi:hypothetical protein